MVGYRNDEHIWRVKWYDFIRHSDGGVSEPFYLAHLPLRGLYQAFRWWGIGTNDCLRLATELTLSGIPMVGYRN